MVVVLGTFFTCIYSLRLIFYVFFKNLGLKIYNSIIEVSGITSPIRGLFLVSVVAGRAISWFFIPSFSIFLPVFFKFLILLGILGLSLFVYFYISRRAFLNIKHLVNNIYFMGLIWFIPILSTLSFIPLLNLGKFLLKTLDQGWVEFFWGARCLLHFTV